MRRFKSSILIFLLLNAFPAFSQNEDYVMTYIQEISRLEKEIATYKFNAEQAQKSDSENLSKLHAQLDSLVAYDNYRKNKKQNIALEQSLDSEIQRLELKKKNNKKSTQKRQTALELEVSKDRSRGISEALKPLSDIYTTNSFDYLTRSTTLSSLQQDRQLLATEENAVSVIDDLIRYHEAMAVLDRKYAEVDVNDALNKLSSIKRDSEVLKSAKQKLADYSRFNSELINAIHTCVDNQILVVGLEESPTFRPIRKKYLKNLATIFRVVSSEGFSFYSYPYLSDAILDIIKIKKYHPDDDLSSVLSKLN